MRAYLKQYADVIDPGEGFVVKGYRYTLRTDGKEFRDESTGKGHVVDATRSYYPQAATPRVLRGPSDWVKPDAQRVWQYYSQNQDTIYANEDFVVDGFVFSVNADKTRILDGTKTYLNIRSMKKRRKKQKDGNHSIQGY